MRYLCLFLALTTFCQSTALAGTLIDLLDTKAAVVAPSRVSSCPVTPVAWKIPGVDASQPMNTCSECQSNTAQPIVILVMQAPSTYPMAGTQYMLNGLASYYAGQQLPNHQQVTPSQQYQYQLALQRQRQAHELAMARLRMQAAERCQQAWLAQRQQQLQQQQQMQQAMVPMMLFGTILSAIASRSANRRAQVPVRRSVRLPF